MDRNEIQALAETVDSLKTLLRKAQIEYLLKRGWKWVPVKNSQPDADGNRLHHWHHEGRGWTSSGMQGAFKAQDGWDKEEAA